MEIVHNITKWIDHNRWIALALVVVLALGATFYQGCESTTVSLTDPMQEVTRDVFLSQASQLELVLQEERTQIAADMTKYNNKLAALSEQTAYGIETLDRKDLRTIHLLETFGGIGISAVNKTISPAGLMGTLVTVGSAMLAGGKTLDAARKDKIIAKLKHGDIAASGSAVPSAA